MVKQNLIIDEMLLFFNVVSIIYHQLQYFNFNILVHY